jgi:hypothetical protein
MCKGFKRTSVQYRLWFFGLDNVLKRVFANPRLATHIMNPEHRTTNDDHTFWGSPAFKALDDRLNNVLTKPDGNTYALREPDMFQ